MATTDRAERPADGPDSVSRAVLAPITAAERTAQREYDEMHAEQRAFERFRRRVTDIDTVSPPSASGTPRLLAADDGDGRIERVREAFRETVTSVAHYDEVYGEPLAVHFAEELSVELAAGLESDAVSFSDGYRRVLLTQIEEAIENRETFCDLVETELASLRAGREALTALVEEGERPDPSEGGPTDRLDDIARARQESLHARGSFPNHDGHDACSFLYRDHEWTYPVLTAVTTVRDEIA